jgi:hypothetical protein
MQNLKPKTPVNLNIENEYDALMRTAPFQEPEMVNENLEELQDAVESYMNILTERELWIVSACISEGRSLQSIADDLSITKTHVWRLRNQAFDKLRKAMSTDTTIRKSVRLADTWEQSAMQWLTYLASMENTDSVSVELFRANITAMEEALHDGNIPSGVVRTFEWFAGCAIHDMRMREEWDTGHMLTTLCKKQHDYGHENILKFGLYGILVRLSDKIERYANLEGKQAQNESTSDTLMDIVGYSVVALMLLDETFTLQLGDDYGTHSGHN